MAMSCWLSSKETKEPGNRANIFIFELMINQLFPYTVVGAAALVYSMRIPASIQSNGPPRHKQVVVCAEAIVVHAWNKLHCELV